MTNLEIGFAGIGAVLALIAMRVPIGVALGGVSIVGIVLIRGTGVAAGVVKPGTPDADLMQNNSPIGPFDSP